jgi:hypothetical protein
MKNSFIRIFAGKTIIVVLILCLNSVVKSQPGSESSSPQFLFPEFSPGIVKMKDGRSQTTSLNYNTVSERMVYDRNGQIYDIMNPEQIDTVILADRKFVPYEKVFHEVLVIAPLSLFVEYKGELLPPGAPAGYGGTSQVSNTKLVSSVQLSSGYYNLKLPSDYLVKVDPIYWIRKDSSMSSFINERQFLKIFPDKEGDLKQFIKQNKIRISRVPDLIRLIGFCNEAYK